MGILVKTWEDGIRDAIKLVEYRKQTPLISAHAVAALDDLLVFLNSALAKGTIKSTSELMD